MEQRPRKKRRSDRGEEAGTAAAVGGATIAPGAAAPPPAAADAEPATESGYYARQRARDDAARARLKPLAPGERPLAIRIAAALAALLAAANVVLLVVGWEVDGQRPGTMGTLAFSALMATAAYFIWQRRYWAVLGFQALLGVTVLFAFLALLTAANARAVVLCVAIIAVCSSLFWFLVKAMARLQAPPRPTR